MRRLFLVLAKLAGLQQIYYAVANFMQIGFAVGLVLRSEPNYAGQVIWGMIGTVIYLVLSLGMAWVLLDRTEWLADRLRVTGDCEGGELKEDIILRTGIKLIGVYVTVLAVPSLVQAALDIRIFSGRELGLQFWTKVIPAVVQLGLGVLLLVKSARVLELITGTKTPGRTDA